MEDIIGNSFLKKWGGDKQVAGDHTECGREEIEVHDIKFVGLYFAAHWCPASWNFTWILSEFYNEINLIDTKVFEVIYVPFDKPDEFDESYEEMPWMSLSPDDDRIKTLKTRYKVTGIPYLVILDTETGKPVSIRGRQEVQGLKDLEAFTIWKNRNEEGVFSYDIQNHPISHHTTDEAKEG